LAFTTLLAPTVSAGLAKALSLACVHADVLEASSNEIRRVGHRIPTGLQLDETTTIDRFT